MKIKSELLKTLLINALEELNDSYGNAGCNDLFDDEGIMKGITEEDIASLNSDWREVFPHDAKEQPEIQTDFQIVYLLIEKVKQLEKFV